METPNKTRVYLEFGICFDKNFIGRIFIQEVTVMIHKNTDGQGRMAEKKILRLRRHIYETRTAPRKLELDNV